MQEGDSAALSASPRKTAGCDARRSLFGAQTDRGVKTLASGCRRLQFVHLNACRLVTGRCLEAFDGKTHPLLKCVEVPAESVTELQAHAFG